MASVVALRSIPLTMSSRTSPAGTPLPESTPLDRSEEGPAFESSDSLTATGKASQPTGALADSAVTPVVNASPLLDPIGRFQPLEELGRTSIYTTYLARDTEAEQNVALRVYRAGKPKREAERKRLIREAETAEALEHAQEDMAAHHGRAVDPSRLVDEGAHANRPS